MIVSCVNYSNAKSECKQFLCNFDVFALFEFPSRFCIFCCCLLDCAVNRMISTA